MKEYEPALFEAFHPIHRSTIIPSPLYNVVVRKENLHFTDCIPDKYVTIYDKMPVNDELCMRM